MAEILAAAMIFMVLAAASAWIARNLTASPDRAINGNHHGLYLLVNDLVSAQDRGWTTVFPDQVTLDTARRLLAGYEDQITGLAPRLSADRVELHDPDD